jgi:dihydropteroate synthase
MMAKDTFFCRTFSLNCRGTLHEFREPAVMGIVNLTPDSFYSGSRATTEKDVLQMCEKHILEGARILDLGGCSTRPGSAQPSEEEELSRVFPLFEIIRKHFPDVILSIDTYRAEVAKQAVEAGADMINDVSGGDDKIYRTAAEGRVPYILSHIKGEPGKMEKDPVYENILVDIGLYFAERITKIRSAGVKDIIIDPGFGFGKSLSDNYHILNRLDHFVKLGVPVMAGLSRKGMIQKALDTNAAGSGDGTTVANTIALMKGVSFVRVHDVKPAIDAIRILSNLN